MDEFPRDRFDDVPVELGRVGAHRAPVPRNRGWIVLAWCALASGVLVLAGLLALSTIDSGLDLDLPGTPAPISSPQPVGPSAP